MKSIVFVGMDVHKSGFTLSCLQPELFIEDRFFGHMTVKPSAGEVKRYLDRIQDRYKKQTGGELRFICGYEAGCMGYALYHDLARLGIDCFILAPTSMPKYPANTIKTDKRDSEHIAKCLAYGNYKSVYVPDLMDEQVRDYIRMRNDHKGALKGLKQQINAFCLRLGASYPSGQSKWTQRHLRWLQQLELELIHREILDEYLITYGSLINRLEVLGRRIEEFAQEERYREEVSKLICLLGVQSLTGLSVLVETGDFARFKSASHYACYLGLTPGEHSSGTRIKRTQITKAGNSQVRRLLIEAAQSICKGRIGYKSKALKVRQAGPSPQVIAYADRANERLRRKYYRMIHSGKKRNVAVTAVARELACFIWGMMTNHLDRRMAGQTCF
ncbi:MAG: IS110 family transposase [Clostridiaceae bacterium]|jgi:transposase|nr:IS110 family transposase [Clostridiaceae bacterium]